MELDIWNSIHHLNLNANKMNRHTYSQLKGIDHVSVCALFPADENRLSHGQKYKGKNAMSPELTS